MVSTYLTYLSFLLQFEYFEKYLYNKVIKNKFKSIVNISQIKEIDKRLLLWLHFLCMVQIRKNVITYKVSSLYKCLIITSYIPSFFLLKPYLRKTFLFHTDNYSFITFQLKLYSSFSLTIYYVYKYFLFRWILNYCFTRIGFF